MKISAQSHTAIVSAIQKALENYATPGKQGVATDIYFHPKPCPVENKYL